MVKPAEARIEKYTQKFDPTVVASRFTALKDMSVAQVQVRFSESAQMEATIKTLIENVIDSPTEIANYLAFAREVQAKTHKYGGRVLWNEAQNAKVKWVARGLTDTILDSILQALGVTVAIYGGS